jgi:hypothetical protein
LKTLYTSTKKFFDNKNVGELLRRTQQMEPIVEEKKESHTPTPQLRHELSLPSKLKFSKSIKITNPLNGSRDISSDTFKCNLDTTESVANTLSNIVKQPKLNKKAISAHDKLPIKLTDQVFDFSKQSILNQKNFMTNNNSPNLNCFYEEDSTKVQSSKATPDHTRVTPNSIRSERSNSRGMRKHSPPESAKLPTINTNRGKKEYDINNIINVASDFGEDPLIKKKLNDIYQNI